jgi:hypothetical protein
VIRVLRILCTCQYLIFVSSNEKPPNTTPLAALGAAAPAGDGVRDVLRSGSVSS